MTKGIDIANYQAGIDTARVVRDNGLSFVFILANDGTFRNVYFPEQCAEAQSAGATVVPYMYLRTNVEQTVDTHLDVVSGSGTTATIVDAETGSGTIDHITQAHRLLNRRGRPTPIGYIPEWYWNEIGRPSMAHLPIKGLWLSWYADMDPGNYLDELDDVPGHVWAPYGGQPVQVLQFTSSGRLRGYPHNLDLNYYRGSRAELDTLLGSSGTGGDDGGGESGGIESMALDTEYTDWAKNPQTVQSWMNHVDRRLYELHDALLSLQPSRIPGDDNQTRVTDAVMDSTAWTALALGELQHEYGSTVEGSEYTAPMGQMAANADGYGWRNARRLDALEDKVDRLLEALYPTSAEQEQEQA